MKTVFLLENKKGEYMHKSRGLTTLYTRAMKFDSKGMANLFMMVFDHKGFTPVELPDMDWMMKTYPPEG